MTSDEHTVKLVYPMAQCVKETGAVFGYAETFTILDFAEHVFVSPTAFTEENAWKWAAERLRKGADEDQRIEA